MVLQKKKVVQIISALNMGGAEALVKDYMLKLDESRIDATLIVTHKKINSAIEVQIDESCKKVIYLFDILFSKISILPNMMQKAIKRLVGRRMLVRTLNDIKPDVIHLHLGDFGLFGFNRYANKYALKNNVRIFYTIHNDVNVWFKKKASRQRDKRYILQNKNIILIALTDEMKDELDKMFSVNNTIVIRNGIDIKRFVSTCVCKVDARRELNISENDFVIGHIGRMSVQKNHRFLIDIFYELLLLKPEAHLLLVGQGSLESNIKNQIVKYGLIDKVTITSNRSDIPNILRAMDVFVFPSLYEGLGIVLIEAQAAGLKCVVSDRVPKDAIITSKIAMLSLDDHIDIWCNEILRNETNNTPIDRLEEYDICNIIKQLELIYCG